MSDERTRYEIITKGYDEILTKILKCDDCLYELAIVYQTIEGETFTISWLDRNKRLEEEGQ